MGRRVVFLLVGSFLQGCAALPELSFVGEDASVPSADVGGSTIPPRDGGATVAQDTGTPSTASPDAGHSIEADATVAPSDAGTSGGSSGSGSGGSSGSGSGGSSGSGSGGSSGSGSGGSSGSSSGGSAGSS